MKNKIILLFDITIIILTLFIDFADATTAIYDRTSSEKIFAANSRLRPRDPKHSFSKPTPHNINKNQSGIKNNNGFNEYTKYSNSDCLHCDYSKDIKWSKSYLQLPENATYKLTSFWDFVNSKKETIIPQLCHESFHQDQYKTYMKNILKQTNNRLYVLMEGDSFTRIVWVSLMSQYVVDKKSIELLEYNGTVYHLPHLVVCYNVIGIITKTYCFCIFI